MSTKFPLVLNKNLGTLEELAPGDSLDLEGSSIVDVVDVGVTGNVTANTITTLDLTATGTTRLGEVQNVIMTGGSSGQVITTDGDGNLSWATVAGVSGGNSISGQESYVTVFDDGVVGVGVDGVANTVLFEKEMTTVGTDLTVVGNLDVQGTVTYIESTTITLEDNNITLANSAANAADANGAGFTVNGANATITYVSDTDTWDFNKDITGTLLGNATGISADGGTYVVEAFVAAVPAVDEVLDANGNVITEAVEAVDAIPAKTTISVVEGSNTFSWVFDSNGNMSLPGNTFAINYANGEVAVPDLGNIATIDLNGDATQYLNGNGEWATIDSSMITNGTSNVVVNEDSNITISSNGVDTIMEIVGENITRYYTTTENAVLGATEIVVDTVANLSVGQLIVSADITALDTTVASIDVANLTVTLSDALVNAAPTSTVFETYAQDRQVTVTGNLTVTGRATFGDIDHVNIGGGNANFVMKTDGSGNLSWTDANDLISLPVIPRMSFEAVANGADQEFTNNNLTLYSDANAATVFRNGVLVDNTEYTINANAITFSVNLTEGENIDIIPVQSRIIETGATYTGTGTVTSIATAGSGLGFSLTGGTITEEGTVRLNVPTKTALKSTLAYGNIADLDLDGNVSNVLAGDGTFVELPVVGNIAGLNLDGNVSNVLNGNGQWVAMTGGSGATVAGSNTQIQFNNDGNLGASANLTYDNANSVFQVTGSTVLDGDVTVGGNVIPATDDTYTLGNATHRYAHIYVGPNSLTVGNVTISEASNAIVIDSLVANVFSGDGANITGVAHAENANIANVAYSVELANVANIGNIANLDLDGNVSNVLTGNGTFTKLGNIGALDLDGNVSNVLVGDGTFTKLGNIASIDLEGNTTTVMLGDGSFSATIPTDQSNTQILYSDGSNITSSSSVTYNGNTFKVIGNTVTPFSAVANAINPISGTRYSDDTIAPAIVLNKSRGSRGNATTVAVGDQIAAVSTTAYVGNTLGTRTIDGLVGWTPSIGVFSANVTALPAANGGYPSTQTGIIISNAVSNVTKYAGVFDSAQQLQCYGNLIMNNGGNASMATQYIPATASSSGTRGQIAYDASFIYVCTATNTWKRAALATW